MAYTPYNQYSPYNLQNSYLGPYVQPRYDTNPINTSPITPSVSPVQNPIPQPPISQNGFVCRPVTSKEEAMAVQADYLSPGTIMPDLGHGMMYLKRFNANTGLSDFFEFSIVQGKTGDDSNTNPVQESVDYSEIFRGFNDQLVSLSERVDEIKDKIESYKAKPTSQRVANKE